MLNTYCLFLRFRYHKRISKLGTEFELSKTDTETKWLPSVVYIDVHH